MGIVRWPGVRRESPGGPDVPIGRFDPETTGVFILETTLTHARIGILVRMVGRGELYLHGAKLERITNVVTVGGQSQVLHQRVDINRRVIGFGDSFQILIRRYAEVVIVGMRHQHGIQLGNGFRGNGESQSARACRSLPAPGRP